MTSVRKLWSGICLLAVLTAGSPALAADESRLSDLEREVARLRAELAVAQAKSGDTERLSKVEAAIEALSRELERMKVGEAAAPAEPPRGLAPAAGKVYAGSGVSIGGYGEALLESFDSTRDDGAPSDRTDVADLYRAILYVGYKFDDKWVFNSEIEVEHAVASSEADGEVAMELAYLDYLWRPELGVRAGLILVPMGFLNELHEPPIFLGAKRPGVERSILPTTWRELGVGIHGDSGPLSYRAYLTTSLDSEGYSSSGIRSGRQEGSEVAAEDFACTGRVDYTGVPGLLVGASYFVGDTAQSRRTPDGESFDGRTSVVDLHAEWKAAGFDFRGLWAETRVDDAEEINQANDLTAADSIGERQRGWYAQAGYDVLALRPGSKASLTPFVRFEAYDTQLEVPDGYARNPTRDVETWTFGVNYRPIDRVVIKLDWQDVDNGAGTGVNQWNLALGYLF